MSSASLNLQRKEKLPNPWSEINFIPKSKLKPLTITTPPSLRYPLTVKATAFNEHKYPYEHNSKINSNLAPYFEWRGKGDPPADVGNLGDIYIDDAQSQYALWAYISRSEKWRRWVAIKKDSDRLPHPYLHNRYLWCGLARISWFNGDSIKKDIRNRTYPSCSNAIKDALNARGNETELPKRSKRKRDEAHLDSSGDAIVVHKRGKATSSASRPLEVESSGSDEDSEDATTVIEGDSTEIITDLLAKVQNEFDEEASSRKTKIKALKAKIAAQTTKIAELDAEVKDWSAEVEKMESTQAKEKKKAVEKSTLLARLLVLS